MNQDHKWYNHTSPPQVVMLIFLLLIAIGTILFVLPISSANNVSIGWLNALFMATSAICVNGLAVIDIGSSLSTFGQVVLMMLIQIGGLGFMTLSVMVAIFLGRRISLKQRLLIKETTRSSSIQGLVRLCLYILIIATSFEITSTVILTVRWMDEMGLGQAIYQAIFYSISAFNNAGFALSSNSLHSYVHDPIVNLTIMTLFVVGGLGYIVIVDLFHKRSWRKLSLHTKLVLTTSAIIALISFLLLFLLESFNTSLYEGLTEGERTLAVFFQSATPRSAGFNTVEIANMLSSSQLLLIMLMFIGASSGGTGGGIKTNTFAVLLFATINTFRGGQQIHIFHRRITTETVMRALAVVISSLACIFCVALLLTITEGMLEEHFLEVLFEATSAFSTTGLSMGLTRVLSPIGKLIITITMFIGRLGPLTLAYALANKTGNSKIGYPEEHIPIG